MHMGVYWYNGCVLMLLDRHGRYARGMVGKVLSMIVPWRSGNEGVGHLRSWQVASPVIGVVNLVDRGLQVNPIRHGDIGKRGFIWRAITPPLF